jgi:hypothetical protein
LSLIAPNGDWVDVQTVAIGPRETIRVKRYYRADDSPRTTRPTVVASRLTLDEVKEASAKVSSAALEAALVETNAGFDLTKKSVLNLAAAGVSTRVIDLLVALSYPEKFAIQAVGPGGGSVPTFVGFGSPYYYDPFYYGYGSPYLYEPFGYRGYIFLDGGVGGVGGGGGVSGGQQPSAGRVINGQGYTRIVPRDTVPSTNTQNAGTASTSRSYPSDSGSSSSSSSSGSSSSGSSSSSSSSGSSGGGGGGSTVSPSGASSGGSSDSGRTAVPR